MKTPGSKRLKMPFLTSIISMDCHSVSLEIFQMTKEGREVLESLDQSINLGADVFKRGAVSIKKISAVCGIMQEFAQKMREYDVKHYRVMIKCAVRAATNCDILISRVKTTSGIDIELIPPSEEIRLLFQLIRERVSEKYDFRKINTLSFALGSNALLLMVSERGRLKFCESVPLNFIRFFDGNGNCKIKPHRLVSILEALNIPGKFHAKSSQYLLIAIGKNIRALGDIEKKWDSSDFVELSRTKLNSIFNKTSKLSVRQVMEKYQVDSHAAEKIIFSRYILKSLQEVYKCKKTLFPPFFIHDALAADMMRCKSKFFENDIIYVAESIGEKYNYDAVHVENVTVNSLKIFDKIQKKYDLNKRSRLLLNLAARLHNIGRFVDLQQYQKHSYYLISNAVLPGINENEQLIIATVASCHRKRIQRRHPRYAVLNKDEKIIINKLTAILLLGDMLDNFRFYGLDELSMRLSKTNLTIKIPHCPEDLLEQFNVSGDSDLFRETFGLKMKLCGDPGSYEI